MALTPTPVPGAATSRTTRAYLLNCTRPSVRPNEAFHFRRNFSNALCVILRPTRTDTTMPTLHASLQPWGRKKWIFKGILFGWINTAWGRYMRTTKIRNHILVCYNDDEL